MAEQFKTGDVVILKSGGPSMTVEQVSEDSVLCAWFDKYEKKNGSFPPDALTLAPRRSM